MKKGIFFIALFIVPSMCLPAGEKENIVLQSSAENISLVPTKGNDGDTGIEGKIIIHGGIGLNLLSTNLSVRYALSPAWDGAGTLPTFRHTPMINLGVDYGLAKKFSVGGAFGYQQATGSYTDPQFSFQDKWTRVHLAVRGDYHIIAKENIGLYTGLKLGYNIYKLTTTFPGSNNYTRANYVSEISFPSPISVQAHFGFSYFFNGLIGANAEVGLGFGGPYIFAVGVTAKL